MIVINEVARSSSRSDADSFFELRNVSDHDVDLSGWGVYRCSVNGLRAKRGQVETELAGVTLEPGAIYTATRVGMPTSTPADGAFSMPYADGGFGLYLEDPEGALVDAVAVYPSTPTPMPTECSAHGNLPNALAGALGESWQRVATTGDARVDFVRAEATPGEPNATRANPDSTLPVRIDEIAPAGPAGSADDFVELRNSGDDPVDVGGWRVYRCTASGRLGADTLQATLPAGATLRPNQRLLIGGPGYIAGPDDRAADAATAVSLADATSGALVTTAEGVRVDGVSLSNHLDTACQTGDDKLGSVLDYRSGESWQRHPTDDRWIVAPRTAGEANVGTSASPANAPAAAALEDVAISEFAVDPAIDPGPEGFDRHHFVELGNYGRRAVDISGWKVIACRVDGFRDTATLVTVAEGTRIAPGGTWLAALRGTSAAGDADAEFDKPLDFLGAGVWIENAAGRRIDSVGAYHANEMDFSLERRSACSNGLSLATFAPDRLEGETYQRSRFTGVDADDYVTARATPGAIDRRDWSDPATLTAAAADRLSARVVALASHETAVAASAALPDGVRDAVVTAASAGSSVGGPLSGRVGVRSIGSTSRRAPPDCAYRTMATTFRTFG